MRLSSQWTISAGDQRKKYTLKVENLTVSTASLNNQSMNSQYNQSVSNQYSISSSNSSRLDYVRVISTPIIIIIIISSSSSGSSSVTH